MKLPRRRFLQLAAGAAALPVLPRASWAQAYPARPVRIVVGLAPGGANDVVARLVAQWLSDRLGQAFVVENRPGAGGNTAVELVTKSPADGHTLLLVGGNNAINATLYEKLNFDFIRDIAPIASVIGLPNLVIVNPGLPVRTIPEFIAYARAHPGKINVGTPGVGTASHMAGELFNMMTGANLVQVHYRGGAPAVTDVLAGHMQAIFIGPVATMEHIRSGKLRVLASTTATRWDGLPEVPTVAEFVSGYEASNWFGIGAPKGSPSAVITKLNQEINAALDDPNMKKRLVGMGGTLLAGSPASFETLIANETAKWGKVVKFAGMKPI